MASELRKPFFEKKGNTVIYNLYVIDTLVSYDGGKKRKAMAINGQIPAPTLEFVEGETAEIWVHNLSHMETTLHWHGLILPNEQDGVPFLTTKPTESGESHLYKFPIVQNGTYWY
ncbi:MAG: copper oxidase, partial [Pseudopedobacter saltans]